jgi:hypothetical protein
MTSGRYLLDTGIVAALFRGDTEVGDRITASEEIFVSSITLGELFYGAFKSQRTEDEVKKIAEFAARCLICMDISRRITAEPSGARERLWSDARSYAPRGLRSSPCQRGLPRLRRFGLRPHPPKGVSIFKPLLLSSLQPVVTTCALSCTGESVVRPLEGPQLISCALESLGWVGGSTA